MCHRYPSTPTNRVCNLHMVCNNFWIHVCVYCVCTESNVFSVCMIYDILQLHAHCLWLLICIYLCYTGVADWFSPVVFPSHADTESLSPFFFRCRRRFSDTVTNCCVRFLMFYARSKHTLLQDTQWYSLSAARNRVPTPPGKSWNLLGRRRRTPLVFVIRSYSDKTFFFTTRESYKHCSMDVTVVLLYVYTQMLLGTMTGSCKILLGVLWKSPRINFGQDSGNPV